MGNWGFIEWFGVISGVASIISLIITLVVREKVVELTKNITSIRNTIETGNTSKTSGKGSPIQNNKEGDNKYEYYEGGK